MTNDNPAFAVVRRFIAAIEQGDLDALNATFAPQARIWHNTDQRWQTKAENSVAAAGFFEAFSSRTYRIDRIEPLADGAMLQFVATIVRPDGRSLDWPACAIFRIENALIVDLMEYIDAASFAAAVG